MVSSSFCWSCLSQLRPAAARAFVTPSPSASMTGTVALFHTSAARAFPLPPKKSKTQTGPPKYRESKSARMKKKKTVDRARPPAVGERKALRKRIILSNPNALPVEGLPELSAETMVDMRLRGTVVGIPISMVDQLRAVQAFKPKQGWSIFRQPGTVFRKETLQLGRLFERIETEGEDQGKVFKKIITGVRGSGKSVYLLQAMAMAFTKKWVVISVPETQDLVIGHTAYAPMAGTDPTLYSQNEATASLLSRTLTANEQVLSKLIVSQAHPALGSLVKPNTSLAAVAQAGIQDPAIAWTVFQALWTELTATKPSINPDTFTPRPPLLVTVDGIAHWMKHSEYRSADNEPIHAHDLVFVRHFLSLLKPSAHPGCPTLPNGGLLMYATSASNNPSNYSLEVALKQVAARQAGVHPSAPEFPHPEPYSQIDNRVLDVFAPGAAAPPTSQHQQKKEGPLEVQMLGGLERDEARGFMEYFARSGLLRETINDAWVGEKWSLAGGGIVGELEKLGRRLRVSA